MLLESVLLFSLLTAPPRAYEVERYDVDLRLDPASRSVTGTARIRVRSLADGLSVVELDAEGLTIGEGPAFVEGKGTLSVRLPRPLARGRRTTFTLRYSAKPTRGLRFFPDQAWTAFSTSHWMPCDMRPDRRSVMKLRLRVPAGWTVVTSGDAPIPSFVSGFAAGRFQVYEKGKLRLLSAKHTPEELRRLAELTEPMLAFFERIAGRPYPRAGYTQVLAHGNPMQELGGFTLLPEEQPDDLWLMAHELAHQWWGIGIVYQSWSDFWLNEGMATFLADVYLGERFGAERYRKEIERSRRIWEELKAKGQDRPLHFTGWTTPQQAGGPLPYHKGAWALHLLREEMGAEAFWRGLRAYTREYWGRSVTSAEFQQAMERASGRSLQAFFDAWVY